MQDAACRDVDTEIFFPVRGRENDESVTRQIEYAKSICASCPVVKPCRDYILTEDLRYENDFGIWAGLTPEERHRERRELRNQKQRERRKKLRCKTPNS